MTLRVWIGDWRQDSRLVSTSRWTVPRVQRNDHRQFGPAVQVGHDRPALAAQLVGTAVAAAALGVITAHTATGVEELRARGAASAHVAAAHQPIEVDGLTWSVRTFQPVDDAARVRSTSSRGYGPGERRRRTVRIGRRRVQRTAFLVDGDRSWRSNVGPPCGAATSIGVELP